LAKIRPNPKKAGRIAMALFGEQGKGLMRWDIPASS